MVAKIINLFFLWRRNNLPSIVFKCIFWGATAWLLVGIFSELKTALIGGGVAAGLAAIRYTTQYRKEQALLLAKVGGDKNKLAQLRKTMSAKGIAGGMMTEMLRAEMDSDFDDDDDDDVQELSEEQKSANVTASTAAIEKMYDLCVQGKYAELDHCNEIKEELLASYSDGDSVPELVEIISEFLPESVIEICPEGYCNDDDHAGVMQMFSEATNGKWNPGECSSSFDEDKEQWSVRFMEDGEEKIWRFQQSGDWLSEKYLQQVINYTEAKSGCKITIIDAEDFVSALCLPLELHELLADQDALQAA